MGIFYGFTDCRPMEKYNEMSTTGKKNISTAYSKTAYNTTLLIISIKFVIKKLFLFFQLKILLFQSSVRRSYRNEYF